MNDDASDIETEKAPAAKTRKRRLPKLPKPPKVSGKAMAGMGAAIGIGSAAIVAALLYTNRNKKS